MGWLKNSQSEIQLVQNILNRNMNAGIDAVRAELERKVPNYCNSLWALCNGQVVNSFYMTVWQQLCSEQPEPAESPQPEIEQNDAVNPETL